MGNSSSQPPPSTSPPPPPLFSDRLIDSIILPPSSSSLSSIPPSPSLLPSSKPPPPSSSLLHPSTTHIAPSKMHPPPSSSFPPSFSLLPAVSPPSLLEKKTDHHFGDHKVIKKEGIQLLLKTFNCSDRQEFEELKKKIDLRKTLQLETIFRIVDVKEFISENLFCTGSYRIQVQYEYHNFTLLDDIKARAASAQPYSELELFNLIDCVLSALILFSQNEILHESVNPSTIFLSPKNIYKLHDISFINDGITEYIRLYLLAPSSLPPRPPSYSPPPPPSSLLPSPFFPPPSSSSPLPSPSSPLPPPSSFLPTHPSKSPPALRRDDHSPLFPPNVRIPSLPPSDPHHPTPPSSSLPPPSPSSLLLRPSPSPFFSSSSAPPSYLSPSLLQSLYEHKLPPSQHNYQKSDVYSLGLCVLQCIFLTETLPKINLDESSPKTAHTIIRILKEMLKEEEDQRPDYASLFEMLSQGIEEEENEEIIGVKEKEDGRGWKEEGGRGGGWEAKGRREEESRKKKMEDRSILDERVKGILENTKRLQEEFEREGLRDDAKEDLEFLEGKREELLKKSTLIKNVWKKEKENLGFEESVIESGKLYEVYMEEYNKMKAEMRIY